MSRNIRTRIILARAATSALHGTGVYFNKPEDTLPGGAGGGGNPEPKKIELTEQELTARLESARKDEREKAEAAKKKEQDDAAAEEARQKGEHEKIAQQETEKREKAERERDEANRRAQLAEVNNQLRDHLAGDDARKTFLANAPDIMLHIEKNLAADAKAEDVTKLIEAETKGFIERTAAAKGTPSGAPSSTPRGKVTPETKLPERKEEPSNGNRRFASLNWNG